MGLFVTLNNENYGTFQSYRKKVFSNNNGTNVNSGESRFYAVECLNYQESSETNLFSLVLTAAKF